MILDKILEHKRQEVKEKKNARYLAALKTTIRDLPAPIGFYQALAALPVPPAVGPSRPAAIPRGETPRLIAEVKKASPSKGVIREDFDPLAIALLQPTLPLLSVRRAGCRVSLDARRRRAQIPWLVWTRV